jgi:hypothetical protein
MRTPLMTALSNPLNLAMLALSALAGLIAAWWLFPLGLALWAVMVLAIARDQSVIINYNMQARQASLSPRFQGLYAKVVRSQMRIFNSLLSASGRTRRAMEPVQGAVEELVNHVFTVCEQMTAPENYLKISKGTTDLEGERALLVLGMKGISDPVVRKEKEDAVRSLEARMGENKNIAAMLDRVEAQLSGLVATMDGLLAEIVRLQAGGSARIEQEAPNLLQKMHQETDALKALETEAAQHPG